MQKKGFLILMLTLSVSLSSCDWFRARLGMPTSKEIKELQEKVRQDSILRAEYRRQEEQQRQLEESIFDSDIMMEAENVPAANYPGYTTSAAATTTSPSFTMSTSSASRFHIIVGSFYMPENAHRMLRRLSENGYHPIELQFRNGYLVVSAGSYDHITDAYAAMRRMQANPVLCPQDSWVYDMRQGLHR